MRIFILISITTFLLVACQQAPVISTLRDVDTVKSAKKSSDVFVKPKSEDEIRQAYADYLKHSATNDNSRMSAINRLAELEFKLTENILKEKESLTQNQSSVQSDALYDARLDKTIELLETALRDYPDAKNNDKILYQLAKAYAQRDHHAKSIKTLGKIADKYKKSPFYTEAQFRLAEEFFPERIIFLLNWPTQKLFHRRRAMPSMKKHCSNVAGRALSKNSIRSLWMITWKP